MQNYGLNNEDIARYLSCSVDAVISWKMNRRAIGNQTLILLHQLEAEKKAKRIINRDNNK